MKMIVAARLLIDCCSAMPRMTTMISEALSSAVTGKPTMASATISTISMIT